MRSDWEMPRWWTVSMGFLQCAVGYSNGILEGLRERREQLRAVRRHVPAVFQPYAEFSGNVNSGLVREAHAEFERGRVPVDEISGLVTVKTDAVAGAMRKPRQLVARSPAFALVISAHRVIELAGGDSDLRLFERDLLAAPDRIPHPALA